MIKIGLDLDGVLCDFNTSFLRLLQEIHGGQLGPSVADGQRYMPDRWNWCPALGFSRAEIDAAWHHVQAPSTAFWEQLEPLYPHDAMCELIDRLAIFQYNKRSVAEPFEVYFLTSRPGPTARLQSLKWLYRYTARNLTVLITSRKGHVAHGLGLDLVIDDHVENVLSVLRESETHATLFEQPYSANHLCVPDPDNGRLSIVEPTYQGLITALSRAIPPGMLP